MRVRIPAAATTALGSLVALSAWAPTTYAWGAAGHEIIATIAQIHLHPSVLPIICALLDVDVDPREDPSVLRTKCHISTIATWADKERMRIRWSAAMHYVGALDDFPRERCEFPGPRGWAGSLSVNVLDGVKNVTHILAEWSGVDENELGPSRNPTPTVGALQEEAFKFLVHFVGDMHQPLHLTGRARGGNGIKVRFGNRSTNLHSVWDTSIPAKLIRTVGRNYSHPLPDLSTVQEPSRSSPYFSLRRSSPRAHLDDRDEYPGYIPPSSAQIESGLRGTIYDALIRRIMWEGVRGRWAVPRKGHSEVDMWGLCPVNSTVPTQERSMFTSFQVALGVPRKEPIDIGPDGPLICPYAWSQPIHTLNCKYIWPEGTEFASSDSYDEGHDHAHSVMEEMDSETHLPFTPPHSPLPNLDIPSYMGPLERDMVLERLMAQGGLRLAGILNWMFADWDEELNP